MVYFPCWNGPTFPVLQQAPFHDVTPSVQILLGATSTKLLLLWAFTAQRWQLVSSWFNHLTDTSWSSVLVVFQSGPQRPAEFFQPSLRKKLSHSWTLKEGREKHISDSAVNFLICVSSPIGGKETQHDVWKYNSSINKWIQIEYLNIGRWRHKMVVLGSKVYVIGGFDGLQRINNVEAYDPFHNCWSEVKGVRRNSRWNLLNNFSLSSFNTGISMAQ